VVHVDILGAFIQTPASDVTIIKFQGVLVMTLLKVNPSWKKFVVYEGKKRTPTIYSKAIKALYGTVDAAKLFYDNKELKFTKNPYDSYVVNKMIMEHSAQFCGMLTTYRSRMLMKRWLVTL